MVTATDANGNQQPVAKTHAIPFVSAAWGLVTGVLTALVIRKYQHASETEIPGFCR